VDQSLSFNRALVEKYDRPGPRYTSYPTAPQFHQAFAMDDYHAAAQASNQASVPKALSLYIHIPFCKSLCYYCACNKIITQKSHRAVEYLNYLKREIAMQAALFDRTRTLRQLHLGGGTPTYLTREQLAELMDCLHQAFNLDDSDEHEFSIEVDPRTISTEQIEHLRQLGFNRLSFGVQDFDPDVQAAVNRQQSEEQIYALVAAAREAKFKSVSVDLIYGLPKQNVISFNRTLEQVLEISPDRISLYSYAHLPGLFKPQRRIFMSDMPTPDTKLQLLQLGIRRLTEAGYVYIGMDHFAKPNDELTIAQRQGRLHRNFQGYSTQAECDLLAFGVSAIGKIGPVYAQNVKTLDEYYDALDRDELPVLRGIELTADDLLRRAIIQALMCHFELSMQSIEIAHLINFREYFAEELADLKEMEKAGLVKIDGDWISVQPGGRLLVRGIAMVFDRYLRADRERARYSRVI